jgi:2-phosphoglycerate kinase
LFQQKGSILAKSNVVLVGGAPGAGRTTFGRALATRLGVASLTVDDLFTAAKTFTTPESHPGLHVMNVPNAVDCAVDKLIADATAQHEAIWPAIERVIRVRASSGSPIVIDGWYMRPEWVTELGLDSVASFWLDVDPAVLEGRERGQDFYGRSSDPERMLQNFLGRSYWYNDLIRQQAGRLNLNILHQDGDASVEELCDTAMRLLGGDFG